MPARHTPFTLALARKNAASTPRSRSAIREEDSHARTGHPTFVSRFTREECFPSGEHHLGGSVQVLPWAKAKFDLAGKPLTFTEAAISKTSQFDSGVAQGGYKDGKRDMGSPSLGTVRANGSTLPIEPEHAARVAALKGAKSGAGFGGTPVQASHKAEIAFAMGQTTRNGAERSSQSFGVGDI